MEPVSEPATLLPPRHVVAWGALVVAVVFLPVPVLVLAQGADEIGTGPAVGIAAVVLLLFVALPLWGAARLFRQRILVTSEEVQLRLGDRVARQLRYADLTEVRPVVDGSLGSATPEIWNKAVLLFGTTPDGRRTGIKVTRQQVTTIDPLLRALVPVVDARPDLIRDDTGRRLFAEYLATGG